jgi:hypothetical protein
MAEEGNSDRPSKCRHTADDDLALTLLDAGEEFVVVDSNQDREYRIRVGKGGTVVALYAEHGWVVMPVELVDAMYDKCLDAVDELSDEAVN